MKTATQKTGYVEFICSDADYEYCDTCGRLVDITLLVGDHCTICNGDLS